LYVQVEMVFFYLANDEFGGKILRAAFK